MRQYSLENTRNIGIMAHIDAGKTTLTERILYYTGKTHKMGEVHEGTAVMDWMAQEQERGITITSAATTVPRGRDTQINIIDTPGHVDFTMEVERSLRVLDGAVALFSTPSPAWSRSRRRCGARRTSTASRASAFVNKMDRIGADFFRGLEMMVDRLGANPVALQIPIGREAEFRGIIDLVEMHAIVYKDELGTDFEITDIPDALCEQADEWRLKLVEAVADHDDHLLETYIEGGEITPDHLRQVIRQATLDISITPVLCGSAFKNKGVQPLMDAIVDYLPAPSDVPPVKGITPKGDEVARPTAEDAPFSALAFKVAVDPYVGKLTYFRVYSGTLKAGSYVYNSSRDKRERISRILQMHANHREDRDEIYAGELAAAIGLKVTGTGDTLCDPAKPIVLESMDFPEPVIWVAIEPKTKADEEKLANSLQRLAEEDPTFRVRTEEETGQTIIAGMGELHLEIIVDRLVREFNVDANVGKPQVAYRETVRNKVDKAEGRFVRQTGGRGQYGHVVIELEPNEPGGGLRVREPHRRRHHPARLHPFRRRGHPGGHEHGRARRLSHGGHQGGAHRRQLPRCRLVGHGLQDRRVAGLQERGAEGKARPPGAHDGRGGGHAGRLHGRRDGRHQRTPRAHRRHGAARQRAGHHRDGAAVHDVRVRDRPSLHDAGSRHVHHAVQALRRSAGADRQRDSRESARWLSVRGSLRMFAHGRSSRVYCRPLVRRAAAPSSCDLSLRVSEKE